MCTHFKKAFVNCQTLGKYVCAILVQRSAQRAFNMWSFFTLGGSKFSHYKNIKHLKDLLGAHKDFHMNKKLKMLKLFI